MADATGIFFKTGKTAIANNDQIIAALLGKPQQFASRICARNQKRICALNHIISKLISGSSKKVFAIRHHHVQDALKSSHLISIQKWNGYDIHQLKMSILVHLSNRSSHFKRMTRTIGSIISNQQLINSHTNPLPSAY